MGHRQTQRAFVSGKHRGEKAFEELEDAAVSFGCGVFQIAAAKHRGQRQ